MPSSNTEAQAEKPSDAGASSSAPVAKPKAAFNASGPGLQMSSTNLDNSGNGDFPPQMEVKGAKPEDSVADDAELEEAAASKVNFAKGDPSQYWTEVDPDENNPEPKLLYLPAYYKKVTKDKKVEHVMSQPGQFFNVADMHVEELAEAVIAGIITSTRAAEFSVFARKGERGDPTRPVYVEDTLPGFDGGVLSTSPCTHWAKSNATIIHLNMDVQRKKNALLPEQKALVDRLANEFILQRRYGQYHAVGVIKAFKQLLWVINNKAWAQVPRLIHGFRNGLLISRRPGETQSHYKKRTAGERSHFVGKANADAYWALWLKRAGTTKEGLTPSQKFFESVKVQADKTYAAALKTVKESKGKAKEVVTAASNWHDATPGVKAKVVAGMTAIGVGLKKSFNQTKKGADKTKSFYNDTVTKFLPRKPDTWAELAPTSYFVEMYDKFWADTDVAWDKSLEPVRRGFQMALISPIAAVFNVASTVRKGLASAWNWVSSWF
jgi:hypothetical protein